VDPLGTGKESYIQTLYRAWKWSKSMWYSQGVIVVSPQTSVQEAAAKMLDAKVGCLVVEDEDGNLAGIVTERDIVNRVVGTGQDPRATTVGQIMIRKVVCCRPGTAIGEAQMLMTANRIRHLPVVDGNTVVGMVSARDLMEQQLLEDRAAAQEVVELLSTCLKCIDLHEVAQIITREVPKLFEASHCVLCLHEHDCTEEEPNLVSSNKCLCPRKYLERLEELERVYKLDGFFNETVPLMCHEQGAEGPSLVIPLEVSGLSEELSRCKQLRGYICMCGLSAKSISSRELTSHKAKLAMEILNSHLTNAKLYQDARLTSLTDALTGVGSRKLLEDKLEVEFARAKRYKRPFSIAIIDLDNFKTINDTLGHAAGDEALKRLAASMKSQKRRPDVLARYGGDEFVVLMPETRAKEAQKLLERLRRSVHKIKVGENLPMTISCGIAESAAEQEESASEVMRRADLALYEAKSAGRNCVKIWNESMSRRLHTGEIDIERIRRLQRRIAGLSEQAEKMFLQSIWGLVQALEAKDVYAKQHSEHVMHYAVGIATAMGLPTRQVEIIQRAAMLHDIGKIGVPDSILAKPARLSPWERRIVEQHPQIGVRILNKMTFLEKEVEIVRYHHEKWNGEGYPEGLCRGAIPLGARILAVADTLDALTSDRSYHTAKSVAEAVRILDDSAGYEFDPEVIKATLAWVEEIGRRVGKEVEALSCEDLLDCQRERDKALVLPLVGEEADEVTATQNKGR